MMWDSRGRSQENLHRSRSKSPQPPPMRMPSPSFPVAQTNSHSPNTYAYGATLSASYQPSPTFYPPARSQSRSPSPYSPHRSHDYASVPRSVTVSQGPQYPQPAPQVVHVIHHSRHHHHSSKHNHKPHHSYSYSYTPAPPTPITPSTSYHSAPPKQQRAPSPRVHFPTASHLVTQPATLYAPPRTRVHSQPTMPTAMHRPAAAPAQRPTNQHIDPLNPHFQYSKCTGKKKALCIGINYRGQANELRGCVNDAKNVRNFLIQQGGYKATDIVLLTDDARDARSLPTRDNIIDAMRWLVRHAKINDSLFFHCTSELFATPADHPDVVRVDQTRDTAVKLEIWMEMKLMAGTKALTHCPMLAVIYPLDFKTKGHIVDDEMHEIMVKPLPPGCRLTGLFDACHSGTVLDLPYIYSSHGRLKGSHVSSRARAKKATPADVISWSGCKDGQTSADTFAGGVAVGAMSHAFIQALKDKPSQTYQELLRSVRMILHPRYSQRPQLGSSHQIASCFL
ncbi:hypothetical protein CVT25_015201 [Psilocybe cyanescens]|uniref:Peptidase C14 caspase domain-containing protein n=1 Tax=Psilocybe cyanescens TaxID=93625 RepID=A0A409WRP6_PSICY|nr:hypothetical protein CVT25_015201 [Psilocybe cyanescens]